MVYRNWESIERDINDKVVLATLDATTKSKQLLQENLIGFYDTEDPVEYERTYHLKNSWDSQFDEMFKGAVGRIWLDTTEPYDTGTYTTQMVFENAESGYPPSNILGHPFFWEHTMAEIENDIIPKSFGRFFTKV